MAQTVNDLLLDHAISHAIDLTHYSNTVVRRMIAVLDGADADLVAALAAALERLPASSFTVGQLQSVLASVRQINAAAYGKVFNALPQNLLDLTTYEVGYQTSLLDSVIPAPVLLKFPLASVAPQQVYAAAMAQPFQGGLLSDWAASTQANRLAAIQSAVRMGYVEGQSVDQIVRRVRGTAAAGYTDGTLEGSRKGLASIVRTAVGHTQSVARSQVYKANGDIIEALQWVSVLDNRTTPMCFPSTTDALPIGDLRSVFRRAWDGDLVVVTTASGKQLRATPNHPVLTARGWRPIQEVEPGADVLYRVGRDVGAVVAAEDVEVPASLGAIFDALREPAFCDVKVEGSSQVDFHGDGQLGNYEVNHARSERHLRLALEAALGQQIAEKLLILVGQPAILSQFGQVDEFLLGAPLVDVPSQVDASAVQDGVQRRLADLMNAAQLDRLDALAEPTDDHRFISTPPPLVAGERLHDASSLEHASDGRRRDPEITSDTRSGCPVNVVADDVVSISREFFSGHVCNLSTSTEVYIADGFVVHNCLIRDGLKYTDDTHEPIGHVIPWLGGPGNLHFCCRSTDMPVTKSFKALGIDAADLPAADRASMDGQVPAGTTYSDWLLRQSAARQDQVLGATRGKLLRQGGMTVPQMFTNRGVLLSLDDLQAKDAAAFAKAGI